MVEPELHVATGMTPSAVVKLCWYFPPLLTTIVAPVLVTVPALRRMPVTERSVPVPFATVRVKVLLTTSSPPASTTTWSAVTLAPTVTTCALRMVTVLAALSGAGSPSST